MHHAIYIESSGELVSEAEGEMSAVVRLASGQACKSYPVKPVKRWNKSTREYDIPQPGPSANEALRVNLIATLSASSTPSDKALALILKALRF